MNFLEKTLRRIQKQLSPAPIPPVPEHQRVWGTCADCPKDMNGRQYPQYCMYRKRYDHQIEWVET